MLSPQQERQHRAMMAAIRGQEYTVGKRPLGQMWGRRGSKGRILLTSAGTRDRLAVLTPAAKLREVAEATTAFTASQKAQAEDRRKARRWALKVGLGTAGGAVLLGAGAVALSPRLQLVLGRRLLRVERPLPVQSLHRLAENLDDTYRAARGNAIHRLARRTGRSVQWLERKILGYTPGVAGHPLPTAQRVNEVQDWLAEQQKRVPDFVDYANKHLIARNPLTGGTRTVKTSRAEIERLRAMHGAIRPDLEVQAQEMLYGKQLGLIDKLDRWWKRRLQGPVRRVTGYELDPEWTLRYGHRPMPDATLAEQIPLDRPRRSGVRVRREIVVTPTGPSRFTHDRYTITRRRTPSARKEPPMPTIAQSLRAAEQDIRGVEQRRLIMVPVTPIPPNSQGGGVAISARRMQKIAPRAKRKMGRMVLPKDEFGRPVKLNIDLDNPYAKVRLVEEPVTLSSPGPVARATEQSYVIRRVGDQWLPMRKVNGEWVVVQLKRETPAAVLPARAKKPTSMRPKSKAKHRLQQRARKALATWEGRTEG